MNWYRNMKIAQKLIIGFLVMAIIAAVVGAVGIFSISNIKQADQRLYNEDSLGMQYAGNAAVTIMQVRYLSTKLALDKGDAIKATVDTLSETYDQMDEYLKKCHETIKDPEITAFLNQIQADWDKYKPTMKEENQKVVNGEKIEVKQDMVQLGTTIRENFFALFDKVAALAGTKAADNVAKAQTTIVIMIAVVAAGIAVSILLGVYISRVIGKPVRAMAGIAKKLAVGDLELTINLKSRDEIGELADAFRLLMENTKEQVCATERIADGDLTTEIVIRSEQDQLGKALSGLVKNLNEMVTSVVSASDQVASGSRLVSDSSVSLSQGATEQASSVQELTASLEEISTQTEMNAKNAENANELATKAKAIAEMGNIQMKEMLQAMEEINISSANINKIIKVIDDIAFQTNILALNAAVEAARAGQHGKGFAVVAEEVRTLAAKSANAAQETTDMIENSIRKVEAGTKIANETAAALSQIVDQVSNATELVGAINTASKEQAHGIEQINQGIQQVSQVVQTNAATSEESAAASEELSSQADQLKETISIFKLKKLEATGSRLNSAPPVKATASLVPHGTAKREITLNDGDFGKY
jgi:methyl-accepting chemotaxis protein